MTTSLGISNHLKCTASSLEGIAALLKCTATSLIGIDAHLESIAALLEGIAAPLTGLVRIQSAERSAAMLTNRQITREITRLKPLTHLITTKGTLDDALRIGVKPFALTVVVAAVVVASSVVVAAVVVASAVVVAAVVVTSAVVVAAVVVA